MTVIWHNDLFGKNLPYIVYLVTISDVISLLQAFFFKKMSAQFFSKLSQNYIELLEDDEYYDVTIEVGEDPNVKTFVRIWIFCVTVLHIYDEL